MLTQERLDEIYTEVIGKDNIDLIMELKESINSEDDGAYTTLEKIINECVKIIDESNDFTKSVTLVRCKGVSKLDIIIKDYCLQYYEKNMNTNKRESDTYGCISKILYYLENDSIERQKYFDDYLKIACSNGVFGNDEIGINLYINSKVDITDKDIKMLLDNLENGNKKELCIKWLIEVIKHKDGQKKQALVNNTIE